MTLTTRARKKSGEGLTATARVRGNVLQSVKLISGAMALTVVLSGCALLGGTKVLDTYELTAPAAGDGRGRSYRQILIAEPSALKALDGQNIVITPAPGNIQYLKGAQWADRLPKIVQARLAETFQRSGEFKGVGKPGEGLAIDYQVIVEVRAFQIRVNGAATRRCRTVRAPPQRPQRRGQGREGVHRQRAGFGRRKQRLCQRAGRSLRSGRRRDRGLDEQDTLNCSFAADQCTSSSPASRRIPSGDGRCRTAYSSATAPAISLRGLI